MKMLKSLYKSISNFINKILVIPISKLIFKTSDKFESKGKIFENWLSKSNTLLFISLIAAILIFIVIDVKIDNYSESSAEVITAQTINVSYDEDNYVVEGIPESVDITLIGNKTNLYIAKQSPVSGVTIDLWGLKPGTHKVDIKYDQVNDSIKYSVNPSFATVIIYEKVNSEKTLSVDLLNQDSLDSRYIVDEVKAFEQNVRIMGASYKVDKVATVKALVDVKTLPKFELGKPITVSSTLRAYDENGNVVDVEMSPSKVDVNILISSPSKEVPIRIEKSGNTIYNMSISNFLINGNATGSVTVYGTAEALANIEYIPARINVDGLSESTQFKVELEKPAGVKYMSADTATIDVNLSSDIETIFISDVSITHVGLADGYSVAPVDIDSVTVQLTGVSDVVKSLTAEDINAYVDLSGRGAGVHEVDINVTGDDMRVKYSTSVLKMKVRITER